MNVEELQPTFSRLLVKKVKETKTKGGIIIPSTIEDDNTIQVVILAVGPTANTSSEVANIGNEFKSGQFGIMTKYAGVELGKETGVYLINANDLLATIEE